MDAISLMAETDSFARRDWPVFSAATSGNCSHPHWTDDGENREHFRQFVAAIFIRGNSFGGSRPSKGKKPSKLLNATDPLPLCRVI